MKQKRIKPEASVRIPCRDLKLIQDNLYRDDLSAMMEAGAVAKLSPKLSPFEIKARLSYFWKMASEQDIESIESDSPFFSSSSIIPKTILEDLCR